MTIKRAYANAEPMDNNIPMGLIDCEDLLWVIMIIPAKVAIMDTQTGQDGTTFRNTIISATSTG